MLRLSTKATQEMREQLSNKQVIDKPKTNIPHILTIFFLLENKKEIITGESNIRNAPKGFKPQKYPLIQNPSMERERKKSTPVTNCHRPSISINVRDIENMLKAILNFFLESTMPTVKKYNITY